MAKNFQISNFKFQISKKGFSLVELIVSLSITAVIMLGLSVFFASSFRSVFETQERLTGTQGQFVINEIVRKKFANIEKLIDEGTDDYVVFQNKIEEDVMPFTYIGLSDEKLVFKDFFVFNGMYESTSSASYDVDNPAGITKVGSNYYVVAPLENAIYECTGTGAGNCGTGPITLAWTGDDNLNHPTDIVYDGTGALYVTDSENGRIIKITDLGSGNNATSLIDDLNFPVGIDFYNDTINDYLFFSEPYKNKVYRVKISDTTDFKVVVGDGDNELCDNSALYCKLNFPTGVFADDGDHALYIADTGNSRVLKMSDLGYISEKSVNFLTPNPAQTIKKTIVTFPTNTDLDVNNIAVTSDKLNTNGTKILNPTNNVFEYQLWTDLAEDTIVTNACTSPPCPEPPCPPPCIPTQNLIKVSNGELFSVDDYLKIDGESETFQVVSKSADILTLNTNFSSHQPEDTLVYFANDVEADSEVTFDFTNVDTSSVGVGFYNVGIEIYDIDDNPVTANSSILRIGDNVLGTPEDIIEDVTPVTPPDYPTGVFWTTGLQIGDDIDFDETVVTFDYTTDFTITGLNFSKLDTPTVGGKILEVTITTDEQTYTINSALP